jgi:DNA-directed RNA polymerase specialized sigma24 family protein
MVHMVSPTDLTEPQLATRCQNRQPDASHEAFCFELFRRAISEGCAVCWQYLHSQYYALVRAWLLRYNLSNVEMVDDLAQDTFVTFIRFFTTAKLQQATSLGSILKYLKSCAATTVLQARRKAAHEAVWLEWEETVLDAQRHADSAEAQAGQNLAAVEIWSAVEASCQDERERLLARLTLVAGIKPADLVKRYPQQFSDTAEVYRLKRNLVDRLRRHPTLRAIHQNLTNEHLSE